MPGVIKEILRTFAWVIVIDYVLFGLPIPKIVRKCKQRSYMIDTENRFEYQKDNECSGYSSAYVLRHLGIDIDGVTAYSQIPIKLAHGNVPGIGIIILCLKHKLKVRLRMGNLEALKDSVCKGNPVIVFTRSAVGSRFLHYIAVVGFDEEYIYTADSVENHVNSDSKLYNRRIPISDFKKIWQTNKIYQPLIFNLFFEIKR